MCAFRQCRITAGSRIGFMGILVTLLCCLCGMAGQVQPTPTSNTVVPNLVKFTGTVPVSPGQTPVSVVGITFALYKERQGGAPLFMEVQNVRPDGSGRYTVHLGATKPAGLPIDLFASGEARWLGVQIEGLAEEPRVLLLSVPYALKAADAETVGGLPPSAFVLAGSVPATTAVREGAVTPNANTPAPNVGGTGTTNFVPLWKDNAGTLGNSVIFQNPSSNVGIGTQSPSAKLDVAGTTTVRGNLQLPATGAATAARGQNSQPFSFVTSSFNSATATSLNQTFRWVAEPSGNNTTSPSGTLNLLFGQGSVAPSEAGLRIAKNGQITFAPGQTFPGTGPGTIIGVTAGTGLTGGGNSGAVTLNLDTSFTNGRYAQLTANNTFTGTQIINNSVGIGISPAVPLHVNGAIRGEKGLSLSSVGRFDVDAPFKPGGRFTVLDNGNVGIGVSTPLVALHVAGTLRSESGGLSLGGFAPVNVDSPGISGGRFTVLSNGRVGVNTPSPVSTLDVNGDVYVRGQLSFGTIYVESPAVTISPRTEDTAIVICPAGYSVMSGGFDIGGPGRYAARTLTATWPASKDRWVVDVVNDPGLIGGDVISVIATAVCARIQVAD